MAGPHLLPRPAAALPAPQGEQGLGWGRTVRGPKLGLGAPAPGWASQAALCLQVLSWFRPCRTPGFSRVAQEEGLWLKGCRPWGVGWGAVGPALPPRLSLWSQVASEPSGGAVPAWPSTMCPCGTGCVAWGVNGPCCLSGGGGLCRAEEAGSLGGLCPTVFGAGVQLSTLFPLTQPAHLSSSCSRAGSFSSRCGVSVPIPVPTQVHNYQRIEQNLQSPTQYQTTR